MNLMISANQRAAFHTWLCVSVHSSHLGGRIRSPCRSDGSYRRKRKRAPLPHSHWDRLRHGAGQSRHQVGWLTAAEVRCVKQTDRLGSVLSACRRWSCRTSCPASWWTTPTGGGASTIARWVTSKPSGSPVLSSRTTWRLLKHSWRIGSDSSSRDPIRLLQVQVLMFRPDVCLVGMKRLSEQTPAACFELTFI